MSDSAASRPNEPFSMSGMAFGLAAAGVMALIVGTLYERFALSFYPIDLNSVLAFVPALTSLVLLLRLFRRRRLCSIITLSLSSTIGISALLLASDWGASILDASPDATKQYSRYTYTSDVLMCFGFSMQLIACAMLAITRGR